MTSKAAQELGKLRWKGITARQRKKLVPRNGGRPRTYPPCSRYHAHRFSPTTGRCPCGYQKPKKEKRKHGTLQH